MDRITLINKQKSLKFPHHYIDDRIKTSLKLTKRDPNAKYLDIGCAVGLATRLIAKKIGTKEIYGLDIANIKQALDNDVKAIEFDLNSGEELSFEDGFFDVVTCFDVIEHIYDTDFMIREIHRVLKPNGYLIISTPRIDSLVNIILLFLGYQPMFVNCSLEKNFGSFSQSIISGHISHFTKKALIGMLVYHGFKFSTCRSASYTDIWLADQKKLGKNSLINKTIARIIKLNPFRKECSIVKVFK